MAYDGRAVANFVLDTCDNSHRPITNLALQKIVYFCHVWHLIDQSEPLVKHKFEAWEFGPVLPYLYREFKGFDRSPVTRRAVRINPQTGSRETVPYSFIEQTNELLSEVVLFYGRLGAGHLVDLSHVEGGPWHKVWYHQEKVYPGMKIDDAEIKAFYCRVSRPFSIQ